MFKNPGKKVSVFVKVMFWVLSIIYILFVCGVALINSFLLATLDAALSNASNSMGSIMGNGYSYSGGGSIFLIIAMWAMAFLSIILVVLMLYWVSLFLLTVAEMNIELKETKETVQNIENNIQGHGGSQNYYNPQPKPQPVYSQPMQQRMPFYTPSQPYYEAPEPAYTPPTPAYEPPMSYNSPQPQEIQKTPVTEYKNPEPTVPNVQTPPSNPEPVSEAAAPQEPETTPTPQVTESKEDILSKYGPSGNYYR